MKFTGRVLPRNKWGTAPGKESTDCSQKLTVCHEHVDRYVAHILKDGFAWRHKRKGSIWGNGAACRMTNNDLPSAITEEKLWPKNWSKCHQKKHAKARASQVPGHQGQHRQPPPKINITIINQFIIQASQANKLVPDKLSSWQRSFWAHSFWCASSTHSPNDPPFKFLLSD